MEEIQDIMNKMEELDYEVERISADLETAEENCESCPEDENECPDSGNGGNGCGTNGEIHLCCTTIVKHFEVNLSPEKPELRYDVSCLGTAVETKDIEICPGWTVTAYYLKIVGCIPFIFSSKHAIKRDTGNPNQRFVCGTGENASICCQGCICIDNCVKCFESAEDAWNAAKDLEINCSTISFDQNDITAEIVEIADNKGCPNETYVKFSAKLEIDID